MSFQLTTDANNDAINSLTGATFSGAIRVVGNAYVRSTLSEKVFTQASNTRSLPGAEYVVLNPDAHVGYGAPVGCVVASPTHVYPGPVGVDIKCSMSLLQLDVPAESIADRPVRRALIQAIVDRTPGKRTNRKRRVFDERGITVELVKEATITGVTTDLLSAIGIDSTWVERCEDAVHTGHDGTADALRRRWDVHPLVDRLVERLLQVGSYGGGNHFGECEVVRVLDTDRARAAASVFGLQDGNVAFLSHCGSRGFGHLLATHQYAVMQDAFDRDGIPYPGDDRELVSAPADSVLGRDYLDDMALGANFATLNHMLLNALVLDAFQEVLPGTTGRLVYFISHNVARWEDVQGRSMLVHRKGATRAFPAGHADLAPTPFFETGHPILLPGNPQDGSSVMVADAGAADSLYSVNHGAGRALGRGAAFKTLNQQEVDTAMNEADILTNTRRYPLDEAPAAYKKFNEVIASVEQAGLATEVARLHARFVVKDGEKSLNGAA